LILLPHGHYFTFIAAESGTGISQLILFALRENIIAPKQILIVDDDALSREVLTLLLEHAGYLVEAADSGDAAVHSLSAASSLAPDIILSDMQMPGIAGSALALQLRELCGPTTKLLAMSGSIPSTDNVREFDGLLLKPFTLDELANAIAGDIAPSGSPHPVPQGITALDETIYQKLAASMRSQRLEQLYELTLDDAEKRIALMRQSASNLEDDAYRKEAHAIKGGCGMVGAVELYQLSASMEKNGIDTNCVTSLDELKSACKRLRNILIARKETQERSGTS
jgi:CheY-like chemotaxis protein